MPVQVPIQSNQRRENLCHESSRNQLCNAATWLPGSTLTAASETILGGTGEIMFEFSSWEGMSAWEGQTKNPMSLPRAKYFPYGAI